MNGICKLGGGTGVVLAMCSFAIAADLHDYRLETACLIFKVADDGEIAFHDQPAIVSYFRGRSPRTKQRRLSNRVDLDQPATGHFDQGAPTSSIRFM